MMSINLILYVGIALILGYFLGKITNWLKLTEIVGYIIAGMIIGPIMLVITETTLDSNVIQIIVNVTLGLVGFIIGISFTRGFLRRFGKMAVIIAIIQSSVTFTLVTFGVYLLTKDIILSLILGVLGLATAPAGTIAAIHLVRGRGELSRMTIAVVGIDDGIAIIYFVFILAIVKVLMGGQFQIFKILSLPLIEIGGAALLGIIFGVTLAFIIKFIKDREEIFIISIGFILMCIGLSEVVNVSSIFACMVMGIVFINIRPKIGKTTHKTLDNVIPAIFVLFFAIAGLELSLQYGSLVQFGFLGTTGIIIVYIVYRILGKVTGAVVAGKSLSAPEKIQKYLGFALLSQAGVAIGLAILVSNEISDLPGGLHLGAIIISIITLTTVFFEITGPIGVKYALTKAGEAHDFSNKVKYKHQ